jgi:hypothetical protein
VFFEREMKKVHVKLVFGVDNIAHSSKRRRVVQRHVWLR